MQRGIGDVVRRGKVSRPEAEEIAHGVCDRHHWKMRRDSLDEAGLAYVDRPIRSGRRRDRTLDPYIDARSK